MKSLNAIVSELIPALLTIFGFVVLVTLMVKSIFDSFDPELAAGVGPISVMVHFLLGGMIFFLSVIFSIWMRKKFK